MRMLLLALVAFPAWCDPHLLLNPSDCARMDRMANLHVWAKEVREQLLDDATDWPEPHVREFGLKEWALPKEGAGWSHDYVCPVHGVRLHQERGKNICPVDGKDYHGWPIDNVVYMQRNDDNARAARDLGIAYCLTGNTEYSGKVARIVNAYSDLYPTLPIHDNQNRRDTIRGARVMSQTLSEAKWIVPLVFGYDLVRDAMPQADRARFETKVLRNTAAVIAKYDAGTSNWQSWHNAALLAIGLELNDRALIDLAINGQSGFHFQLLHSITPDGPWIEGSWGYHFFALEPLLLTREMAVRADIPVPDAADLKAMLDAPLKCVFPDGTLPNFNDTGLVKLSSEAKYYEIGYRIFQDPQYLNVLDDQPRGLEALLWGTDVLPSASPPKLESGLLASAGMATLRNPDNDHTIAIKFGPHAGGHGHFDKLTFISYAGGAHLAVDPGTQAYGAKSHTTWDKMTVAHNTLIVDETTQSPATGKLLDWQVLPGATEIRVSSGPAYANVGFERTMVQTDGYALDLLTAHATDGKPHLLDWVYHNFGTATSALPWAPFAGFPQVNGYQHLTSNKSAEPNADWSITFNQPKENVRMSMLRSAGTTVVTGYGLGPNLRVPVPYVMARRKSSDTTFAAIYESYSGAPSLRAFHQTGQQTYVIEMPKYTDQLSFTGGKFTFTRSRSR
jgi:hypothetical protein